MDILNLRIHASQVYCLTATTSQAQIQKFISDACGWLHWHHQTSSTVNYQTRCHQTVTSCVCESQWTMQKGMKMSHLHLYWIIVICFELVLAETASVHTHSQILLWLLRALERWCRLWMNSELHIGISTAHNVEQALQRKCIGKNAFFWFLRQFRAAYIDLSSVTLSLFNFCQISLQAVRFFDSWGMNC